MKRILTVVIGLVVLIVGSYFWSLTPVNSRAEASLKVTVEPGMTVAQISELLKEKGLIRSALTFQIYSRLNGATLQAGEFIMGPVHSVPDLVNKMQTGKFEEVSLTIPEGFTVAQIDELLAKNALIEAGDILKCSNECEFAEYDWLPNDNLIDDRGGRLEGYLFPETYFVSVKSFAVETFLQRLLDTFAERVLEVYGEQIESSNYSLHEVITMASLIEEETRTDEERPMVSGILWKRFDDGRGLGVDATVRYILDKWDAPITHADLNVNSPYNTRKFRGLPPGPIANPGIKSIDAAVNPEESEYWYYLHGDDGQIHYAVGNEEHNINRYKYIRN